MRLSSSALPNQYPIKKHWPAFAFFAVYLLLGLFILKDYGMSFDEPWGRENGVINTDFIAKKLSILFHGDKDGCPECKTLNEYRDVDHGPVFEIAATILERVFGLEDVKDIFHLRHLCSFLLFYVSAIFLYLLLFKRFRKPFFALAGVLMLVASPRFFAESFYNAKDVPFLSMSIISSFTLQRFLQKKNISSAIWHALACGIATDIRILGLLFPVITGFLALLDLKAVRKDGEPAQKVIPAIVFYGAFLIGFIIVFWPYLWVKPFVRFPEILARSRQYPWTHGVLYLGTYYPANKLPWHYLPVWIFLSTPLLYTFLTAIGSVFVAIRLFKNRFLLYLNKAEQMDLAMAGVCFVPIIATIALKLVLYDGWRHMYFIYAGFIYLAVLGLYELYNWLGSKFTIEKATLLQKTLAGLFGLGLVQIIAWMFVNHPYQNVYFSVLKGPETRQYIELDYWGLSYRQGLEYILKNSDKQEIKLKANQLPGQLNTILFPKHERERLVFIEDSTKADYYLTEYRWHPQDYKLPKENEVYKIEVDGFKIMSVYKMK